MALFESNRTVYWPAEFSDIALMFQGKNINEEQTHPPMYSTNAHVMVIAAIIGLINKRESDIKGAKKEITIETFENLKFSKEISSEIPLAAFVYLIPMISKNDITLLRPENEEEVIKSFERFAAGGFEYLRGALNESHDVEGEAVLEREVKKIISNNDEKAPETSGIVDIFS